MTKRLMEVIQKKNGIPSIRDNSDVSDLINLSHTLDDYAAFRKTYLESKKKMATEIRDKLKADGFQYSDFLFKEGYDMVSTPEEFMANVRSAKPDDIINDDGMSWGGFANTVMAGTTGGAAIASYPGAAVGALAGAVGYVGTGLLDAAWTAFTGKTGKDYVRLANANTSFFGNPYSVGEEFESMIDTYDDYIQNSLLTSPVPGLHHKISNEDLSGWGWFKNSQLGQWLGFQEQGTGLYSANGAGITIEPGIMSPTWNHFLEVKKALKDIKLDDTSANNGYIAFTGVNTRPDQAGDIAVNKEIFNAIYNDFIPRTNKKDAGLGRFQIHMSPLGGENVGNGAIVFRLPEEYLKKWKPTGDGEKVKADLIVGPPQEVFDHFIRAIQLNITDMTQELKKEGFSEENIEKVTKLLQSYFPTN
jgi:hypothetical protein